MTTASVALGLWKAFSTLAVAVRAIIVSTSRRATGPIDKPATPSARGAAAARPCCLASFLPG